MDRPSTTTTEGYHRIEEPVSGLCLKLKSVPSTPGEAPRIVPKLVPRRCASRFTSRKAAEQIFAKFVPHEALEIVRFDA